MPQLTFRGRCLLAALLLGNASAADLRLYPSFAEVSQTLTPTIGTAGYELAFSRAAWALVQPGSLSLTGTGPTELRVRPTDQDWLASQVGQPVTVVRAGQALTGTLVRADTPLVKLNTGTFLPVQAAELAYSSEPPPGWPGTGVLAQFTAGAATGPATASYRTAALAWTPRYELAATGAQVNLAALAEMRNRSEEAYSAENVELYAGEVRNVAEYVPLAQSDFVARAEFSVLTSTPVSAVSSTGEPRGLQRYALPGNLKLGRGETLSVPFLKPALSDFTRYDSVNTGFTPQEQSGSASRHNAFTSDLGLPAGPISVREEGVLVGTVNLPASQVGNTIDLDLGPDASMQYVRSVKLLSQDRAFGGNLLSTTSQVTYTFTSSRSVGVRVQLTEQVYGKNMQIDGQPVNDGQSRVERRADVPANGTASLTFTLKVGAN